MPSQDRPMFVDLGLIGRHLRSPVHIRMVASIDRLRPKPGSFQFLLELLQREQALLEHQELVLVGGDRIVEVVEFSGHELVLGVVLPQAGELFDVLAELVVYSFVGDFGVAAKFLVAGVLLVLFHTTATALLLLLAMLLLWELVRTFFGTVDVHLSVFKRRCVDVRGCVPVRASVEEWRMKCKV